MKYKIGDRVRVRTWEDMEKRFGTDNVYFPNDINTPIYPFISEMEDVAKEHNRVVTIDRYDGRGYNIKEMSVVFIWTADMFEGLVDATEDNRVRGALTLLNYRRGPGCHNCQFSAPYPAEITEEFILFCPKVKEQSGGERDWVKDNYICNEYIPKQEDNK